MKTLKSYQYERYAVLCQQSYPTVFDHVKYGFESAGHRQIKDHLGRISLRVLWNNKKEVVVVFRGSYLLSDWLVNFAFWPTLQRQSDGVEYRLHRGYASLLDKRASEVDPAGDIQSVFEQLLSVLLPLWQQGKRVSLVGHSSGGALAVLAADRIERIFPGKVKRVVTFGQPAVGSWSFKKNYCLPNRTYRICCDLDVVTFMPPIPGLYWHVGRMLWLHNDKIHENVSEHARLLRSLLSWLLMPIKYHNMSKYIRRKDYFDQH